MSNIKAIIQSSDLDFLIRNAAVTSEGEERKYALPVMVHRQNTDALLFEIYSNPVENANEYIKATVKDKGGISDGYHTFDELYEHRIVNFIAVCRLLKMIPWKQYKDHVAGNTESDLRVWMSKKHSDGSEWEGWFVLGIGMKPGEQITYHLPISKWEECQKIASVIEKAPEWDGHTSADVLERLKQLYPNGNSL